MPTSLMIVLDDNNSYAYSPDGDPCSGHNMMQPDWCWCSWRLGELMMIPCLWWLLMMIVDDAAIVDGFEPLHFMVEPMVQLMYLMVAWSLMMVMVEPCWCGGAHTLDDGLGAMLELTCYALLTWCTLMEMAWWHEIHDGDLILLVMRTPSTLLTLSFTSPTLR